MFLGFEKKRKNVIKGTYSFTDHFKPLCL